MKCISFESLVFAVGSADLRNPASLRIPLKSLKISPIFCRLWGDLKDKQKTQRGELLCYLRAAVDTVDRTAVQDKGVFHHPNCG